MGVALVVIVVAGAAAWLFVGGSSPKPDETANRFLAAWSRGDDRGAGGLSDRAAAATRDLEANRRGLDGAKVRATLFGLLFVTTLSAARRRRSTKPRS